MRLPKGIICKGCSWLELEDEETGYCTLEVPIICARNSVEFTGELILSENFDRVRLDTGPWIYDFAELMKPMIGKNVHVMVSENQVVIVEEEESCQ